MPAIVTLTFNPALDVSTSAPVVEPTHKLRCTAPDTHPGGGGINVARVAARLGAAVCAVYPAGGLTGQRLRRLLDDEQLASVVVPSAQETRESFTVHETSTARDWRFVLPGPELSEPEWRACAEQALGTGATWLVASGSLPPGVPDDAYAQLARAASQRGMRMVLDTSGPPLAAALQAGVYLFKPSLRELQDHTGQPLDQPADRLAACRRLIAAGQAQVVALSLGAEGALVVSAGQAWQARALPVPVASTIGAGDSFVGGMVVALARGDGLADAFRTAMAASAALLTHGTALCRPEDVQRLAPQVELLPC